MAKSVVLACGGCSVNCPIIPMCVEVLHGYLSSDKEVLQELALNVFRGRRIITICQKAGKPVQGTFMD